MTRNRSEIPNAQIAHSGTHPTEEPHMLAILATIYAIAFTLTLLGLNIAAIRTSRRHRASAR